MRQYDLGLSKDTRTVDRSSDEVLFSQKSLHESSSYEREQIQLNRQNIRGIEAILGDDRDSVKVSLKARGLPQDVVGVGLNYSSPGAEATLSRSTHDGTTLFTVTFTTPPRSDGSKHSTTFRLDGTTGQPLEVISSTTKRHGNDNLIYSIGREMHPSHAASAVAGILRLAQAGLEK